jgi:hypothetical protein
MGNNSNDQPSQAFRSLSKSVTYIPTMTDTTGQLIVLWEDIEDVFTGAKSVRDGDTLVPFMKDASFTQ